MCVCCMDFMDFWIQSNRIAYTLFHLNQSCRHDAASLGKRIVRQPLLVHSDVAMLTTAMLSSWCMKLAMKSEVDCTCKYLPI